MLDADILIDIRRGHEPAVQWFLGLDELPSVPGFVVFELYQGCRNRREVARLQSFLTPFPVLWPSEEEARFALGGFPNRHLSHRLGILDALIGACAIGHGATLCTFNVRHYRCIEGLTLEQPYPR